MFAQRVAHSEIPHDMAGRACAHRAVRVLHRIRQLHLFAILQEPVCVAHDLGIQRVFVEGGPTVAASFLRAGLVDEVLAYVAPVLIGSGPDGDRPAVTDIGVTTLADAHRLELTALERLGDDVLLVARPRAAAEAPESPSPETTAADASPV